MLNQPEQEHQQIEILTPDEVRQSLFAELEASKQEIAELSNEQLLEIAGGFLPSREQIITSLYNGAVSVTCCVGGGLAGYGVGQALGNGSVRAGLLGSLGGARAGIEVAKKLHMPSPEIPHTPQGNLEAGTAHRQNYGTISGTSAEGRA